jgi:hypothetical protein
MIDATRFMTEVLAMWTQPDATLRRSALAAHFHRDVRFYDRDGEMTGHAALETFSDSLRSRFPQASFSLASPPQILGNALRAYWYFGPPANPRAVNGMDFAILDGDKVRTLYAFVNVPGTAT